MPSLTQLLDILPLSGTFTVDDAVIVAAAAHHGQRDKGRPSQPYLTHPMRLLATFDDAVHQMIAVLHDAVEDSDGQITVEVLRELGASEVVVDAVEALTHREGEPRAHYLRRVMADPSALAVKLADNRDNSDEARLALLEPSVAGRFRAKYAADRQLLGVEA